MNEKSIRQRLMTILAADVAGYSRLMAADERSTLTALEAARAVFKFHIESYQGRVIDMAGDSVLAAFETAAGAVSAALAVQQELSAASSSVPDERRMHFRIGMHLGDVFEKTDGTVYGDGVNIAARLEALADPGGVTVSDAVKTALRSKVNVIFEDRGDQRLKNLAELVRAFRVRPKGADGAAAPSRDVSDAVLLEHTTDLRRAVGDETTRPHDLQSGSRRGYRFMTAANEAIVADAKRGHAVVEALAIELPDASERTRWVGRAGLIEQLDDDWRTALSGKRQVVFLTGDAGIGKTTLVDMFLARAAAPGIGVLRARCVEQFGAGEAYLPLLEALTKCCRRPGGAALQAKLHRIAPTWLAQMSSLLGPIEREALQREVLGATRERMLRELCELLEALSCEAPLMLVLDDLHWSDYATLDALALLARRQDRAALLILGTVRLMDVLHRQHPFATVQRELQIHHLCAERRLDLLSPSEVTTYLNVRLGDSALTEELAEAIYRRSEGHPLFMVNLVDFLSAEGRIKKVDGCWTSAVSPVQLDSVVPQDLRQVIQRQFECLAPEERRCIEAAAVAGAQFSAALLAAALHVEVMDADTICEHLARSEQWLKSTGVAEWPDGTIAGSYAFLHAVYIEVIYEQLAPAQRVRYHRDIGERLRAAYSENIREVAAQLALHFERAGDYGNAVSCLRVAADHMAQRWAFTESLSYLGRALQRIERVAEPARTATRMELLQQRATVHRATGDMPRAAEDLKAMLASARAVADRHREARALVDFSRVLFWLDRRQCLDVASQAAELSETLDDEVMRAMARANHAAWNSMMTGWREEHARASEEGLAVARRTNDPRLLNARMPLHAMIEAQRSNYRQACTLSAEGMSVAESLGDGYQFATCEIFRILALMNLGIWGEARRLIDESLRRASKNGNVHMACVRTLQKAWLHIEAMDFESALLHCQRARELYDVPSDMGVSCLDRNLRAKAHIGLSQYALAMECLTESAALVGAHRSLVDWISQILFLEGRCECLLGQRDLVGARREAQLLNDVTAQPPERTHLVHAYRLRAEIAMAEQAWDEAREEIHQALDVVNTAEVPLAAWRVHATAAALLDRQGRSAAAIDHRRQASAVIATIASSLDSEDPLRASLLVHAV